MIGVALVVALLGYWPFHWGYYYARGAPLSMTDDLFPSRRASTYQKILAGLAGEVVNANGIVQGQGGTIPKAPTKNPLYPGRSSTGANVPGNQAI